jgi:hypothetical protein
MNIWEPMHRHSSVYAASVSNFGNFFNVTIAHHGGRTQDARFDAHVSEFGIRDDRHAIWNAPSEEVAQQAALACMLTMLDEAEAALNENARWGQPVSAEKMWDDFDLSRYGFTTRAVPPLMKLRADKRGSTGFYPVIVTRRGEFQQHWCCDLPSAKSAAEGVARDMIAETRAVITALLVEKKSVQHEIT